MKILCFGASSSKESINKKLAVFASSFFPEAEVVILDLNDYEMPIYSVDVEKASGIPQKAHEFKSHLASSDGIIISFTEHNGVYSTAFKNIMDWKSRIPDSKIWENKPMFVLSSSPGKRGGSNVMTVVKNHFPHQGGDIKASFSLPSFYANFTTEDGISHPELKKEFHIQLKTFKEAIKM